ncbi:sphingoid long chain base kinase-like protein [Mytilinidion resinicola]|uniref:Sphingoid long chain base kinase-like protein n=1 Tax=Mytilinidion resinicola TaxID=574789 RepID=A0A6A6YA03_9PEZI|nr:sphingoid long chain base kinase-like protein [Mytilinidion resinicola]KAF2804824.1 sphingoid long chain base kinase-like protein [Mytilinidion resinicola]
MTSESGSDGDPFKDPSVAGTQTPQPGDIPAGATLPVGRSASLTLGTDSLIVLDEDFGYSKSATNCCGLLPNKNKTTRSIPFFNILWAELSESDITIRYARTVSKETVRVAYINYTMEKTDRAFVDAWIERLLDRAYGVSQRQKRLKLLVNPFGGQGSAQKLYNREIEPILAAARCEIDVERTKYSGHAVEIARDLDTDAYDVIACCSGDGVPHEVFNGLAQKKDAARALTKLAVVNLPCGSGNAMSWNLNGTGSPSLAALAVVKGLRTPLDLISITQGDRRTLSFLSQAVGIVAESDLATEHLRWLGSVRFTYGFLVRLLGKTLYPADIAVKLELDDKTTIRDAYKAESEKPPPTHDSRAIPAHTAGLPQLKYGTVTDSLPADWQLVPHDNLGNFYAGNMAYMSPDANFFSAALPSDGCMDLVRIAGDIPRKAAVQSLLAVESGAFYSMPLVHYSKVSAYRIVPKNQAHGYISIDGERIPFEPFQAEVHRGLGTVLSRTGHLYEAEGPRL